mgnify:CR=1 FL=1
MKLRSKIQHSMIMVITVTLLAAYALTTLVIYRQNVGLMERETRQEADYIVKAIEISGTDYLKQMDEVEKNTRITLIDPAGDVLYDSTEDAVTLQNHKNRPEIKAAHKNGTGQDVRRSMTMSKEMFYYAKLLPDGNVLRVSKTMNTALHTAISILPIMGLIAVVALAFAYLLSRQQVAKLIRPINELDLEEPLENEVYEELTPLLESIDKQNKEKEAIANMRKEFSANVSHELKTPLTTISGYAELMKDGLVKPEDMPRFSATIYDEARRLISMIEGIIKLSRLDENRVQLDWENVDLYELAFTIKNDLTRRSQEEEVAVHIRGVHTKIRGVQQILYEMFFNICENAIKYNHKGGEVVFTISKMNDYPIVIVEDTGIGIPKEDLDRIFERFYRVDKSHSNQKKGSGLGLSIVKHGAKFHNAEMEVDSELGKGTKITIIFPKQKSDL